MRFLQLVTYNLLASEDASSAVEYAVMLALIVVVCIVAITAAGDVAYEALWDTVRGLE